ncbi:MAG: class II aldolase/adducin family protein [Candidatus Binatia bacterium]
MRINKKQTEELKKKVALGNRILFHQGLADYHGHLSARIPGTRKFLIKPVLAPLGFITSRDIIVVDIDEYKEICEENWAKAGNLKKEIKLKIPPRETMIHASIYEARSDVNSVVHTHQPLATAFSIGGTPLLPIYNQAANFAPQTPIFPSPRLIYTVQDGVEVCQALQDRMGLLLKGHGIVVVGESVEQATSNAIYLERTAQMQWVASCVGTPVSMPQKDIEVMKETNKARSYHAFAYFASLLKRDKKK